MIELIAIIAAIAVCIWTPIEVNKVRNGWVRKNFKGTPQEFRAAYRKQLTFMIWIGVVLGVLNIGLGVIEETPIENYVKYFAGALWFGVSAISYVSRGKLDTAPPSTPVTS